ncbi:MAG: hypothetical protein ACKO9T_07180, partial [Nitrospira sp.]
MFDDEVAAERMEQNLLQSEEYFIASMTGSIDVHRCAFIDHLQVIAGADECRHPLKVSCGRRLR